jgi:carboxyl-terminal processing protease
MFRKFVFTAFATGFLLASSGNLFGSGPAHAQEKKKKSTNTFQLLDLFGDVFGRVRVGYVEEVSDEQLIEAAITGMLTSLDPHSSYMNPKNFRDMQVQTRGKFGGLGIEVTMENGLIKVVSPIDDTPAHRGGLLPGDFITHLDGKRVRGLTLSQAVDIMRGKVGTDIRLTLLRAGRDPFDVTITRAAIPIRTVRSRTEGNIAYLRISSFSQPTMRGLRKAMKKITGKLGDKFGGVVLDLRRNPGGLLDQAVAVSDAFLDKGEIVSTRSKIKEEHQRFNARKGDLAKGKPIVVLIDGGSASASEIVAGALQDHGRAIIMGTKSFGKGSVQTIIPLPRHGAMRLTTSYYYTPSGRSIQQVGIDPDIVVEQVRLEKVAPISSRREVDLRGALLQQGVNGEKDKKDKKDGKAKKGGDAKKEKKEKVAKPVPQDYQLNRALDLLRGVALLSRKTKG